MNRFKFLIGICALASIGAPVNAALPGSCESLAGLVHMARNDFQSLKMRKFDSGTCTTGQHEFRCSWSFPGDTFAIAEGQADRAKQCALAQPGVEAIAGKGGETGFALADDLTLFVSAPRLDDGDWRVRIRLVEKPMGE